MKKKCIILLLMVLLFVLSGCRSNVTTENKEAFLDVEDIADEQQINLHFAWKNEELKNNNVYEFLIEESSEGQVLYTIDPSCVVVDDKLGFKIKTNGNSWEIINLYSEINKMSFFPKESSPNYEFYKNADWKLEPLLDDYHIWLDEYTIRGATESSVKEVESLELFNLIDRTSSKKYTYTLKRIFDYHSMSHPD